MQQKDAGRVWQPRAEADVGFAGEAEGSGEGVLGVSGVAFVERGKGERGVTAGGGHDVRDGASSVHIYSVRACTYPLPRFGNCFFRLFHLEFSMTFTRA